MLSSGGVWHRADFVGRMRKVRAADDVRCISANSETMPASDGRIP